MAGVHEYREFDAVLPLRPYVECYWEAWSDGSPAFRPVELLVPDLRVEVILNCGERYLWAPAAKDSGVAAPEFACIGMRGTSLSIQQPGRLRHFAIRFRPAGLTAFPRVHLGSLTQQCIDVHSLWGSRARLLAEQLAHAPSCRARVAITNDFLLAHLSVPSDRNQLARSAARAFLTRGGLKDVGSVADSHGIGYKKLERLFAAEVGLSPKHFARIVRLQRALASAVRGPNLNLAQLALEMGYADQAHLTRDFSALVGRPPRAFFAERFAVFETLKANGSIAVRPLEA